VPDAIPINLLSLGTITLLARMKSLAVKTKTILSMFAHEIGSDPHSLAVMLVLRESFCRSTDASDHGSANPDEAGQ